MKKIIPMALLSLCVAMPAYANMDKKMGNSDKWFGKIDTNNDSMISKAENDAFAEKMFSESDTNNDGMISKDEMRAKHEREHADMGYKKGKMSPSAGASATSSKLERTEKPGEDTPHNVREH